MTRGTFVFGVGAQKSGTTWLHDYLAARPDAYFGYTKEYHIFDALKYPGKIRKNFEKRMAQALQGGWPSWRKLGIPCTLAMMATPEVYFNYFSGILCQEGVELTGDITPEYACLDEETMEFVRDEFQRRGVRVAPVFIMRDPVERLHSMVRDERRRGERRREGDVKPTLEEELEELWAYQNSAIDNLRSDYPGTIQKLSKVFGDDVFYRFYEELFENRPIESLCKFLNIEFIEPNFEEKSNATVASNPIPEEQKRKIVEGYRDRYEYVVSFFGEERTEAAWPNVRYMRETAERSE